MLFRYLALFYRTPRALLMACLVMFMLMTGGCARTALQLAYPAPAAPVLPKAGAPSICVVTFEDNRGRVELGTYRDGALVYAASPVNDWLARALADELAAVGFVVSYAPSFTLAQGSSPDYIVTGSIDDIWLLETSLTHYSCTIRMTLSLQRSDGTHLFRNNFSSTVTRGTLPLVENGSQAMREAAMELARPAAQSLGEKLL